MFPVIAAGLAGIVVFCGVLFVLLARAQKSGGLSEPIRQSDRRREPRVPVTSEFDLYWQDGDATHKSARAHGIELSEHGLSVRCSKPILQNSVIQVRGRQIQLDTKARVRYCLKKGLSHVIGLELETQSNSQIRAVAYHV